MYYVPTIIKYNSNYINCIYLIFKAYIYGPKIWWIYGVFIIIILSFTVSFSGMFIRSIPNMALFWFLSNERFRHVKTWVFSFFVTCRSCAFYFWYLCLINITSRYTHLCSCMHWCFIFRLFWNKFTSKISFISCRTFKCIWSNCMWVSGKYLDL